MAAETCSAALVNVSKSECTGLYGQITGFWLDETNAGLSYANALLEAQWTAKINAATGSRMYIPFPKFPFDATRNVGDAVIPEGNTGLKIKARDGKADYIFRIPNLTLCQCNRLKSFDGLNCYAYAITANEAIIASDNGTNIVPFEVDVYIGEPISPETQDDFWSIMVYIYIKPTKGYFTRAILPYDQVSSPWRPTSLQGIETVEIAVVSSDASDGKVIFDVTSICDASEINTLLTHGDFLVELTSTGADLVTTAVAAVGNRYTLDVTGLSVAAHRISLKNQPTMTVKGYETEAYTAFTPDA